MKRTGRRILIGLIVVLVLPFALGAAALLFLSSPAGGRWLAGVVEEQAAARYGLEVNIGSLNLQPLREATLRSVEISYPTVADSVALLAFDRLHVAYRPLELLRRRIRIDELVLDGARVHVVRDDSGRFNLPLPPVDTSATPDSARKPFAFVLGRAELELVGGSYGDRARSLLARVDSLDATVTGEGAGRFAYRLAVAGSSLRAGDRRFAIADLLLAGAYRGDTLRVDTLRARTPGASLAGEGDASLATDTTRTLDAGVRVRGDAGELSRQMIDLIPPALQPIEGRFTIDAEVSGSIDVPALRVDVNAPYLRAGTYTADSLAVTVRATRDELALESFSADLFGGRVTGTANLALDESRRHTAALDLTALDLSQVQHAFLPGTISEPPDSLLADSTRAGFRLNGRLDGSITSAGPLAEPWQGTARANLLARVVEPFDTIPSAYRIDLSYRQRMGAVRFQRGSAQVSADLAVRTDSLRGTFRVNIPAISELTEPVGIDSLYGRLRGSGRLAGTLSAPEISASLSSDRLVYRNVPLDSLRAAARFDTGGVHLNNVSFAGRIAPIDTLNPPLGIANLRGTLIYDGSASGTIPDLTGHVNVDARALQYGSIVTDRIRVRAMVRRDWISVPVAEIDRNGERLSLNGNYSLADRRGQLELWAGLAPGAEENENRGSDRDAADVSKSGRRGIGYGRIRFDYALHDSARVSLSGSGEGLDLSRVPEIHPALRDLAGTMAASFEFTGSPSDPRGRAAFTVHALRVQEFELDSLSAGVVLAPSRVSGEMRGYLADGEAFRATAVLPLKRAGDVVAPARDAPIDVAVTASELDLALLNRVLKDPMRAGGFATFAYTIRGTLADPVFNGRLTVDRASVEFGEDRPRLDSLYVSLVQRDSVLRLEKIRAWSLDHLVRFSGIAQFQPEHVIGGRFTLMIDSLVAVEGDGRYGPDGYYAELTLPDLPVDPAARLLPGVAGMRGYLSGRATVAGAANATPKVSGKIRGRDIHFQFAALREWLHSANFTVSFDNNRAEIDTFAAGFGDQGRFTLAGSAAISERGEPRFNLALHGRNLRVEQPDYTVRAKRAELTFVTRDDGTNDLAGDVRVGESRYRRNLRLDTFLRSLQAPPSRKLEQPNEFARSIQLDIRFREADELWVDNNLARVHMDANLRAAGTIANPIVTGRVNVETGYVYYLDRKFTIQRGLLDFVDTREINPYIDLEATANVIDWDQGERIEYTVTLTITGEMKTARLQLTSEPQLEQSSIIALLTFGSMETGGSTITARTESLALQALSGYVGSQVGNMLGLEQVSVQGNLFAFDKSGAQLLATKELSNRAMITYITNIGKFDENTIRVNYFLSDYWTITGETNQEGEGSLDVRFKIRFR
ncbi:MAG: hypothetical protein MAG453_01563 [Calditrichaeota bacterium]|nr:hypothetical protein [Calditrichota bacterium]